MFSLTPLRFIRTDFAVGDVRYGQSQYLTACERFYIHKLYNGDWVVEANIFGNSDGDNQVEGFSWVMWLTDNALDGVHFPTRSTLLQALNTTFTSDSLLDSATAPLQGIGTLLSL